MQLHPAFPSGNVRPAKLLESTVTTRHKYTVRKLNKAPATVVQRVENLGDEHTVLRTKTCRGFLVPLAYFELRPQSKLKQQQKGVYECICFGFEVG